MSFIIKLASIDLSDALGVSTNVLIMGLMVLIIILIVISIVNGIRVAKLRKSYRVFMEGNGGRSLENVLSKRMKELERMLASNEDNKQKLQMVLDRMDNTYQKMGLVKYNAFDDLGGKLSFSLALLNRKNDGLILNAMHSREGCFTYIKEIINGNPVTMLADEEREALQMALNDGKEN